MIRIFHDFPTIFILLSFILFVVLFVFCFFFGGRSVVSRM